MSALVRDVRSSDQSHSRPQNSYLTAIRSIISRDMASSLVHFFWRRLRLILFSLSIYNLALGQFIQEYQMKLYNGQQRRKSTTGRHPVMLPKANNTRFVVHWRREVNDPLRVVLQPNTVAQINYNCYYMKAICQNAREWLATDRAKNRQLAQWGAGSSQIYGYDLGPKKSKRRGSRMCDSFKDDNVCPQRRKGVVIQPDIMPDHWTTAVETINPLNEWELEASYQIDISKPIGDPARNR